MLGYKDSQILSLAVQGQSNMTDGCALYDADKGKMVCGSYTTGTVENPLNHLVEVFRLKQGERGEIDCKCHESGDCPFWIEDENHLQNGYFDDEMIDEFGDKRIDCCIQGCLEDWDIEEDIEESVEIQVRDLLSEHLNDTISKLNEIRVAMSDILAPYDYFNVRQDNWEMRVLDAYVECALMCGFNLSVEPNDYLDAEIQDLASCQYNDDPFWQEIGYLIEHCQFDEVLQKLTR